MFCRLIQTAATLVLKFYILVHWLSNTPTSLQMFKYNTYYFLFQINLDLSMIIRTQPQCIHKLQKALNIGRYATRFPIHNAATSQALEAWCACVIWTHSFVTQGPEVLCPRFIYFYNAMTTTLYFFHITNTVMFVS